MQRGARRGRCTRSFVPVTFDICCIDTGIDLPPKFNVSLFALTGIAMETQGSGITVKLRGRLKEAASPPDCEGLV